MVSREPDKKPDIKAAEDRGERISLMEPLALGEGSRHRQELTDLALELAQRSAGFRRSLPESLLSSLATRVRAMNCYYSNLIEGHDTHPNRGELPRGDVASVVGTGDRQARRVVSALVGYGVLVSDSTRAPLRLAFPATLASRWMPGLFPDRSA